MKAKHAAEIRRGIIAAKEFGLRPFADPQFTGRNLYERAFIRTRLHRFAAEQRRIERWDRAVQEIRHAGGLKHP